MPLRCGSLVGVRCRLVVRAPLSPLTSPVSFGLDSSTKRTSKTLSGWKPLTLSLSPSEGERVADRPGEGILLPTTSSFNSELEVPIGQAVFLANQRCNPRLRKAYTCIHRAPFAAEGGFNGGGGSIEAYEEISVGSGLTIVGPQ